MAFNDDGGWESVELSEEGRKCTVILSPAARKIFVPMSAAAAELLAIEVAMRHTAASTFLENISFDTVDLMQALRCQTTQFISGILAGSERQPPCLIYEDRPGFKWVPKNDD